MGIRTTESTVTFRRPFTLSAVGGVQAAGTYRLVIDEELLLGLSFVAHRRVAAMLDTPAFSVGGTTRLVYSFSFT